MTTYQNSWNNEIEKLLGDLNAPDSLHEELVFILSHNDLTQIYPNSLILFADSLEESILAAVSKSI